MNMGAFLFAIIFTSQNVSAQTFDAAYTKCNSIQFQVKKCIDEKKTNCDSLAVSCIESCSVVVDSPNPGAWPARGELRCGQKQNLIACLSYSPAGAAALGQTVVTKAASECKVACGGLRNMTTENCSKTVTLDAGSIGTASVEPAAEEKGTATPLVPGSGNDDTGGTDPAVAPADTSADSTDPASDTTYDDPLTTASADTYQQQQMAQGLADIPIPNINLGGGGVGGIDFTSGPQAQPNFSDISSAVSSASLSTSYSPTAAYQNKPFAVQGPGFGKPVQNSPGGQAGNSPMSGGSGMMNQANMRPNSPAASARRYGGGPTVPTVASGFYPPGGKSPGGSGLAKRTTASKSKIGAASYKNKAGNEGLALSRLFGGGSAIRMGGGTQSYGGDVHGRSCLDTVFCSMESYFQKVDRYPNSDLKVPSK